MDSLIRWKKGDYIRLGRAISRFNENINEIEVDERDVLPSLKNYKEIKESITSRKELNRVINALNRANASSLMQTREFESGEVVTKWEFDEINKAMRRATRNLEVEKANILGGRQSIGMGDERLSEIRSIESSLEKLNSKKGKDFEKLKQRSFTLWKFYIK